jgi:hypothetical protein
LEQPANSGTLRSSSVFASLCSIARSYECHGRHRKYRLQPGVTKV